MSKVFVRPHILNGGEIWFQRTRIVPSLLCMKVGYDWYMYDTPKYLIHERLNELAKESEKLLAALTIIERDLKEEKKYIEKCVGESRNVGDWDFIDTEKFGKHPITGEDLIPAWGSPPRIKKPEQHWKKVFHPKLLAKPAQRGAASRQPSREGQESGRTVFIPESMSQFHDSMADSTGSDTVVPYRHGNGKNGNNGQQVNMKSGKKQPGESKEGHENRRNAMSNGDYDPDTWELH